MRIPGLDSIRGVAAFMVVLNHFYDLLPQVKIDYSWAMHNTPLHWLVSGRFAVILFFVLSGFVLALPYRYGTAPSYGKYVVRRICRIYLPFVVAVCVAAGFCAWLASPQPEWASGETDWSYAVSPALFFSHVLMQGVGMESISLNPPIWSLIYEMRISMFFPVLSVLAIRRSWWAVLTAFVLGYGAAKAFVMVDGQTNFYVGQSALGALCLTLYYVPFFFLGAKAAISRDVLLAGMERVPVMAHWGIFGVLFLLPFGMVERFFTFTDMYFGAFALYLIFCCQSFGAVNAVLMKPALAWLGKVSYSMYLIHLPVLLGIVYLGHDWVALPVLLVVALPVILVASEGMHRWVEKPSQRLGKWLTR